MKTILSFLIMFLFLGGALLAQNVVTIGTGTASASTNALLSTSTTTNNYSRTISIYTAAEIAAAGGTAGLINKLAWYKDGTGEYTSNNMTLAIYLKHVPYSTHATDPVTWATEVAGATQVFSTTTGNIPTGTGWKEFVFTSPFTYNGAGNLEILVDFYRAGTPTAAINWQYTTLTGDVSATQVGSAVLPTVRTTDKRPNVQLFISPAAGNDAGVANITAPVSPVQPGVSVPVQATVRNYGGNTLTSATLGFKIDGTIISNNIPFTGNLTTGQASTAITLGNYTFSPGNHTIKAWTKNPNGGTDLNATNDTTTISVLACNAISGTYTINKNAAAGGTNYQSFTAALQAMTSCGISGAVTFNVVTGTGPYNEQITIPAINGASATNTITFNGNGNKLSFATTSANRTVITLDGADYITINNLEIEASDATYGWGILLENGADNNTISNNIITIASSSTTEANSTGIVFSNSTSSVTVAGNTGNNNLISNNTITGGFKGIHLNGIITGTGGNQIRNNTIKDFYSYGIAVSATNGTIVDGNDLSRPDRTANTTFYGVHVSNGAVLTQVSKNRIHNSDGGDLTPSSSFYGLYIISTDAAAGSENIFKNNLIYDVNTTGGIYGIYNSGSDGAHYYHNSINLDNAANNGKDFGFYQITAATNVKFVNNIIKMNMGTGGLKYLIYISTTTSTLVINNNILYYPSTLTNHHTGYFSANKTTLTDWQAANGNAYDQNSHFIDPQFAGIATGNLRPLNPLVENKGQAAPAVNDDIIGTLRNTTNPDPGAYESIPVANDLAITSVSGPVSSCGITNQETLAMNLINYGTTPQTNFQVSYKINNNPVVTETFNGTLASFGTATHTFTTKANLSASGNYNIVYNVILSGDADNSNNADTLSVTNSLIPGMPSFDFETVASGISRFRTVMNTKSTITESTAASNGTGSTKGMIMAGIDNTAWITPAGLTDPWINNPSNFSAAYICFNPAGGTASDSLWLTFDLKQLFKQANVNTNFRITVNGTQIGNTYTPPFSGTPIVWNSYKVDLTAYKNLPSIELGFESSVKEEYALGTGTANLIDNIMIKRRIVSGVKADVLATKLSVYPNPSNGNFNVSLENGKAYSLEVTDLTGKSILKQAAKGDTQLKLENAAKGIYLLKVSSEGATTVRKLIVE